MRDAPGRSRSCSATLGARIESERDRTRAFDVIVLDAFSGDSIPLQLFTREAMRLYLARLAPGGVIAANISNRYLDLRPVASALASRRGLKFTFVTNPAAKPSRAAPGRSSPAKPLLFGDRGARAERAPGAVGPTIQ
jgi:hypothetical protein